jgi:hypothetical protein
MQPKTFDNPFRMYGVDRELAITSPAPKAAIAASRLDEVQVSAYHTSDDVAKVRYRFDDGGWKALSPSGDSPGSPSSIGRRPRARTRSRSRWRARAASAGTAPSASR